MKEKLFVDMDGVLADLVKKALAQSEEMGIPVKDFLTQGKYRQTNFFLDLEPMEGAIEGFNALWDLDFYDIYILTKPSYEEVTSFTDKRIWIGKHLGEERMTDRLIMCADKGMVKGDYLIDDWEENKNFGGEFIHFGKEKYPDWPTVVKYFKEKKEWVLSAHAVGRIVGHYGYYLDEYKKNMTKV
jgi:5'(3')-deoxyribonucleotidase|tara:strand:+ start:50917 stop:51471 length:555 start_codon:yes stop_codon:yes gene_type:complete